MPAPNGGWGKKAEPNCTDEVQFVSQLGAYPDDGARYYALSMINGEITSFKAMCSDKECKQCLVSTSTKVCSLKEKAVSKFGNQHLYYYSYYNYAYFRI